MYTIFYILLFIRIIFMKIIFIKLMYIFIDPSLYIIRFYLSSQSIYEYILKIFQFEI